jgi:hypothetical protein
LPKAPTIPSPTTTPTTSPQASLPKEIVQDNGAREKYVSISEMASSSPNEKKESFIGNAVCSLLHYIIHLIFNFVLSN